MKVFIDDDNCRGHGVCAAECPAVFGINDDGAITGWSLTPTGELHAFNVSGTREILGTGELVGPEATGGHGVVLVRGRGAPGLSHLRSRGRRLFSQQ